MVDRVRLKGDAKMTAFNAVRFRVKPAREDEFLEAHKKIEKKLGGPRARHHQDGRAHLLHHR